jgi:uncharacterized protein (UPF0332 family)
MFDTSTLYHIGKDLQTSASTNPYPDAAYRSSIGRYYYACYHLAKNKILKENEWDNKDKSNHKAVAQELRKKNRKLAAMLDDLRILREHADYHVWRCKNQNPDKRNHPRCDCDWDPDASRNCEKAAEIAGLLITDLQ